MEEQQQQKNSIPNMTPYAAPMHSYGSSIILLTDPASELRNMELTYRSMNEADGKLIPCGEPLMNDKGIKSIVGQVQSIISRITIMSNLKKDEIPAIIDFLGDTLAKDLMINRVTYGINDVSARDKIYFTALTSAFITSKRAYEGDDKRFWKGSQMEITNRTEGVPRREGMISRLVGWGK